MSRLARIPGSVLTVFYRGVGVVLIFLVTALLARNLSVDDFGRYTFILSLITVTSLLSDKLVPALLVREMTKPNCGTASLDLIRSAFTITFLLSCVSLALFLMARSFIHAGDLPLWLLAALALPVLAFNSVRDGILKGIYHPVTAQFLEQIMKPVAQLILLTALYLFFAKTLSLYHAFSAYLFSVVCVAAVGVVVLRKRMGVAFRSLATVSFKESRLVLVGGLGFILIGGLAVINANIDVILVTIVLDEQNAAFFKTAQQPAQLTQLFPMAIYGYMLPRLAKMLSISDINGVNVYVRRYIRHCAAMSLTMLMSIVLFGPVILQTVYGEQYSQGYSAMVVMSGAFFLEVLTGPKAGIMNMKGRQYLTALLAFLGIALNVVIDLVFLERYGFIAAAYGTLASSVFVGVTMAVYCKKKLGVVSYLS